jgi:hypothetical protein
MRLLSIWAVLEDLKKFLMECSSQLILLEANTQGSLIQLACLPQGKAISYTTVSR